MVAKQNPMDEAQDLQKMLVGYAKQETVEPLKALGKYLGLGMAGSVFVFLGMFFLGLGVLRLMQTETGDSFQGGSWGSMVPYLVAIVVLLLLAGMIVLLFNRAKKRVLS